MTLTLDRARPRAPRKIDVRLVVMLLVLAAVTGTLAVILAHAPPYNAMTEVYLAD